MHLRHVKSAPTLSRSLILGVCASVVALSACSSSSTTASSSASGAAGTPTGNNAASAGASSAAPGAPSGSAAANTSADLANSNAWQGKVLNLGLMAGTTGKFGNYGVDFRHGAELAVKEINDAGGVNGAKISLHTEETGNDPVQATRLAKQLAGDSSIAAIMGPQDSASAFAVAPTLDSLKIVGFFGGLSPWNGSFNKWTFRDSLPVTIAAEPFMRDVSDKLHITNMAVIYEVDNEYSKLESNAIKAAGQKYQIKTVDTEAYTTGQTDFSTLATKIAAANPQAIYLSGTVKEAAAQIIQLRKDGWKGQFLGGYPILADPSIMKLSNNEAAGAVLFTPLPYDPNSARPQMAKFVTDYKATYNTLPGDSGTGAYTAVYLIAHAAEVANSLTDRDAIRQALSTTSGFPGPWADYTYKGSGDNTTGSVQTDKLDNSGAPVPLT